MPFLVFYTIGEQSGL